jgi:hypothetical protein
MSNSTVTAKFFHSGHRDKLIEKAKEISLIRDLLASNVV